MLLKQPLDMRGRSLSPTAVALCGLALQVGYVAYTAFFVY